MQVSHSWLFTLGGFNWTPREQFGIIGNPKKYSIMLKHLRSYFFFNLLDFPQFSSYYVVNAINIEPGKNVDVLVYPVDILLCYGTFRLLILILLFWLNLTNFRSFLAFFVENYDSNPQRETWVRYWFSKTFRILQTYWNGLKSIFLHFLFGKTYQIFMILLYRKYGA